MVAAGLLNTDQVISHVSVTLCRDWIFIATLHSFGISTSSSVGTISVHPKICVILWKDKVLRDWNLAS